MSNRLSSQDTGYEAGDLSLFPAVLDDRETLYTATNNAKTTLKQTLTYNGKVVVVEDTSIFPETGQIRVGYEGGPFELISYQKKTPNTFQILQRGFGGSKQGIWPPGKTEVTNSVIADHHNALKDAVINIEKDLGLKDQPDSESLNGILKSQEVRFLSPKPLFRAYPRKGKPGLSVRFQNFTTGHVIRYFWDFGDGSTSLEKSPAHTYSAEGQYTVKLNVITSTGAQGVQTKKNYITINKDETIPFFYVESVASPYSIETAAELTSEGNPTEPKTFVFVDQSDGDIVQRNWIFGDGTQHVEEDPDSHTISHTYSKPGNYVVTLLVVLANTRLKRVELPEPLVVL
jgi:PKD repeat protein